MYDNNYIIGFVKIIKKKVTFKNTVHVILIPNIKDYIDENIFNDIWYNNRDYQLFIYQRMYIDD